MNLPEYQPFCIPPSVPVREHVRFCLAVIEKYRQELPQLRSSLTIVTRQKGKVEQEAEYWRQKYQEKEDWDT